MQRLYHLLRLTDTACRVVRIGRITAVRHVVVHRVIAPVIAVLIQLGLVYATVIEHRQNLQMGDTQLFEMVQSRSRQPLA